MEYKIITDSCCDFNKSIKNETNITKVPLTINMGVQSFTDDDNFNRDGFILLMKHFKGSFSSACPSPIDFFETFENNKINFVVTLSKNLSGSYQSAVIASEMAKEKGIKVFVFDSKTASCGMLLICLKIRELCEKISDENIIYDKVTKFIDSVNTFFLLETLDNLVKNGRMNKITGALASLMNIRAVLGSDGNGNIKAFGKARSKEKAKNLLIDTITNNCNNKERLIISHCNNLTMAVELKKYFEDNKLFKDVIITETGGISSMYAGEKGIITAF